MLSLSCIYILKYKTYNLEKCNSIQEFQEVFIEHLGQKQYKIIGKNGTFYSSEILKNNIIYDILVECKLESGKNELIRYQEYNFIRKFKLVVSILALFIGIIMFITDFKISKKGLVLK